MLTAWRLFGVELGPIGRARRASALVQRLTQRLHFLYRASANKWWFDDINHVLFVVIGGRLAAAMAWFDREIVDGIVNGIGALTRRSGTGLARVQTGPRPELRARHRPRADRDGRLVLRDPGPLSR